MSSVIPWLKASWLILSDPFLAGSSCCVKRAVICGHLTAQQQQNFMLLREVAQYCITSPHPLPSLVATLLLCTAVRSTLSGFQVSEAVTCSLSLCAWSVSFTTYGHLQLQLWHKYHYFFLFYRWMASLCVRAWNFCIHWGWGEQLSFSAFLGFCVGRVLHWEWKCSCLTTPPSFSLTASAE